MIDERRKEKFREIMSQYVPQQAVDDIVRFINDYSVYLKITRERQSKFGDYRMPSPKNPVHTISVNGNLGQYGFLLVMLHELAHMLTFIDCGRKVKPHGLEWQERYRQLILRFAAKGCFPAEVTPLLNSYASSLPLSKKLERDIDRRLKIQPSIIQIIAQSDDHVVSLDTLPAGSHFLLAARPDRTFESIEKLRTRWKCRDMDSGQLYTVSADALVIVISSQ